MPLCCPCLLRVPIIIGGATTSELHVALRIAPEYDGPVVWSKDAASNVGLAVRLLNAATRADMEEELKQRYATLRAEYEASQQRLMPLDEARRNKLKLY